MFSIRGPIRIFVKSLVLRYPLQIVTVAVNYIDIHISVKEGIKNEFRSIRGPNRSPHLSQSSDLSYVLPPGIHNIYVTFLPFYEVESNPSAVRRTNRVPCISLKIRQALNMPAANVEAVYV